MRRSQGLDKVVVIRMTPLSAVASLLKWRGNITKRGALNVIKIFVDHIVDYLWVKS